ncbi:DUF3300 domain-containing protein [Herbaspirillum chlorophenolicum]|uniref:DUF3300 domain-containing protein n=1 Tax=Herbaspirillum chlorophenolicum TaxID=211589 RepID=UPI00067B73D8|nr:DUF3300 domain-containing protein [Herbaspirillum chlorophenolicum]
MNKKTLAWAACLVFSLVSGMPAVQAQSAYSAYPPGPASYSQEQLDQMLAPVALYPDSLLGQVLMASTYPLEVVQAQRFVEARPGLQGDDLARAVAPMPWDPSVKSLVQFPSVLAMMNDRLDWMQQLGQAFLTQQAAVMDTVQDLRERAQVAGSLQTSPQQRVLVDDNVIVIEPVDPQVIYVPYYNPVVVYGSWWWPSNPPVYWAPPPRYRPPHYNPGVTASITFGGGIGIGVMRAAFGEARPDWRHRQMMVTQTRITNITNNNVTNNVTVNRNAGANQGPVVWRHDSRYDSPRAQQRPNALPANAARPQQAQPVPQPQQQPRPEFGNRPDRPFMPPAANPQQRVIQEDQARQRQVREQQANQTREIQAQQQQREQQVQEQQRQREQQANNQQRQREQQAQQYQVQQQAREQQRQVQQVRQQQEQVYREQQARPQQQQREQRPPERRIEERRDDK